MIHRRMFVLGVAGGLITAAGFGRAQRSAIQAIGFLSFASRDTFGNLVEAFRKGLNGSGYVEGRNIIVEYRWAEGRSERLPALAKELVERQVAVIAVGGSSAARRAAKDATATIPIVFGAASDPIKEGLVANLNRPGGNITGISLLSTAMDAKRLGILCDMVPSANPLAALVNPKGRTTGASPEELQLAARKLGRELHIAAASNEHEIDAAFETLSQARVKALLITADVLFNDRHRQLIELARRYAIPAIYEWRDSVTAGGLMSYGTSVTEGYRQMGVYVGKILQGSRAGDLPVLQLDRFELVINLKTANALGLTIPQPLLLRADQVLQ